jgi:hypothetical protein
MRDADEAIASMSPMPSPTVVSLPASATRVEVPRPPRIYDSNDLDVTPPVTLKQDLPRAQRPVPVERSGILFIVVDERGGCGVRDPYRAARTNV